MPAHDPPAQEELTRTTPTLGLPAGIPDVPSAAPTPTDGPPVVPGYEVVREIGRGGMGRVFAARDLALGRDVAVKVLAPGVAAGDPAAARRFVREAEITARLPHPGIPPVYALGTLAGGGPFLAMKLVAGQTLADRLDARPDPAAGVSELVGVFEQVCQAVGFAHSQGVVHRDLKPANVMVGAFGEVQVMDWGLAKAADGPGHDEVPGTPDPTPGETLAMPAPDVTRSGAVLGTPAYMAPEQARGEPVGARADVFALGAVLLEILTGERPYGPAPVPVILSRAAAGQLAGAGRVLDGCGADPELVAIARRCLAPDPADRPADGGAVAGLVAAYRVGVAERLRAAEAARAAGEARAAELRKRRRVQRWLTAAAAVILAGGGFVGWREDRRRARAAEAVEILVGQAEAALRADDAAAATAAVTQAEEQAADGGGDAGGRLARCRDDLVLLSQLNGIDDRRWATAGDRAPGPDASGFAWQSAFSRFGGPHQPGGTAAVARRVRESHVRERLLAALDQWLVLDRGAFPRVVLAEADPDDFRDAVRDAAVARDAARLHELAGRPAFREQPPRFVAALSALPELPADVARAVLDDAVRRHPGDLRLLIALHARFVPRKAAADERVGWYRAAIGVNPASARNWLNLGGALGDRGDWAGATAAYRETLRLDPTFALAHANLGAVALRQGDPDAAIAACREALRIDTGLEPARRNLTVALQMKERQKK